MTALRDNMPPIHPGEYIKQALPEIGINQNELAAILNCSKQYVSDIINGRKGLTVEMYLKLAEVLGSTPDFWANLQQRYDLKNAEQNARLQAELKQLRVRYLETKKKLHRATDKKQPKKALLHASVK